MKRTCSHIRIRGSRSVRAVPTSLLRAGKRRRGETERGGGRGGRMGRGRRKGEGGARGVRRREVGEKWY